MPTGRAEMGAEAGCTLAAVFIVLVLIGTLLFSTLLPWWLWLGFW
jgi:hypothetical protein